MKNLLFLIAFFTVNHSFAQEDYTLRINDTTIRLSLDKEYKLMVNGKKMTISLNVNDTMNYSDNMISFKFPKEYSVSKTKIEGGIEQLMIINAEGSGFLIQKYSTLNPSSLNEIMLNEVTKESLGYGYEMKKENYKKTLQSGKSLNVTRAVLHYKDDTNIYEVASTGKKDEGILIVTMKMNDKKDSQGQKLIDMIWNTLRIN